MQRRFQRIELGKILEFHSDMVTAPQPLGLSGPMAQVHPRTTKTHDEDLCVLKPRRWTSTKCRFTAVPIANNTKITKCIDDLWEESNVSAFNKLERIHCKTCSMSVRLVFETRAKCQDFVARFNKFVAQFTKIMESPMQLTVPSAVSIQLLQCINPGKLKTERLESTPWNALEVGQKCRPVEDHWSLWIKLQHSDKGRTTSWSRLRWSSCRVWSFPAARVAPVRSCLALDTSPMRIFWHALPLISAVSCLGTRGLSLPIDLRASCARRPHRRSENLSNRVDTPPSRLVPCQLGDVGAWTETTGTTSKHEPLPLCFQIDGF